MLPFHKRPSLPHDDPSAPPGLPLRIGLIGAGGTATVHIEAYGKASEAVRLVTVSDVNSETVERRIDELGVPGFLDYRELLASDEVDAVDICLPHNLHAEVVIADLRAGKHVVCEKPLATDEEALQAILLEVKGSSRIVAAGHNQVFRPAIERLKALLREGAIGDIHRATITCTFRLTAETADLGWRANARHSGGGELMDSGIHPVYLILHLMDDEPLAVSAMLSKGCRGPWSKRIRVRPS